MKTKKSNLNHLIVHLILLAGSCCCSISILMDDFNFV